MPASSGSKQRVLAAIDIEGPVAPRDLQILTGLARRTIYTALQELLEEGLIRRRLTFDDTRVHLYERSMRYEETASRLGQR